MKRELVPMAPAEWPVLHRMMVRQDFPAVPHCYEEARPLLAKSVIYGLKRGQALLAGFVIGKSDEGISFLDVVCAPEEEGRWASRGVLRELCREVFDTLALRCIWVQVYRREALKTVLKAGFVPVTPLDGDAPVLALTRNLAKRWMKEKDDNGKFV